MYLLRSWHESYVFHPHRVKDSVCSEERTAGQAKNFLLPLARVKLLLFLFTSTRVLITKSADYQDFILSEHHTWVTVKSSSIFAEPLLQGDGFQVFGRLYPSGKWKGLIQWNDLKQLSIASHLLGRCIIRLEGILRSTWNI